MASCTFPNSTSSAGCAVGALAGGPGKGSEPYACHVPRLHFGAASESPESLSTHQIQMMTIAIFLERGSDLRWLVSVWWDFHLH